METLSRMPDYAPENDPRNLEWFNEERIDILDYPGEAMEVGISPDGEYLLFNDNRKNKDMHWSSRIDDRTYRYRGKVVNTVSGSVDGTPCFDGGGTLFFTTLKTFPSNFQTLYSARFEKGAALSPVVVVGDIYRDNPKRVPRVWISLDPGISGDGRFLFYSEGRFGPRSGFPYPFNVRGAEKIDGRFVKMKDQVLENINTGNMEYAPAISSDGLELFFSRIGKVDGRLEMIGIFTARRASLREPFSRPERIMAITGDVEAPCLSGDESMLYYHRKERGKFKIYRVTRKQGMRRP